MRLTRTFTLLFPRPSIPSPGRRCQRGICKSWEEEKAVGSQRGVRRSSWSHNPAAAPAPNLPTCRWLCFSPCWCSPPRMFWCCHDFWIQLTTNACPFQPTLSAHNLLLKSSPESLPMLNVARHCHFGPVVTKSHWTQHLPEVNSPKQNHSCAEEAGSQYYLHASSSSSHGHFEEGLV